MKKPTPTHREFSKKEHIEAFVGRTSTQKLTCNVLFVIGKTETWSVSIYDVENGANKYVTRKIVRLTETATGYDIIEGTAG